MDDSLIIIISISVVAIFGAFLGKSFTIGQTSFWKRFSLKDVILLSILEILGFIASVVMVLKIHKEISLSPPFNMVITFMLINLSVHIPYVFVKSKNIKSSLLVGMIMSGFFPIVFAIVLGMLMLLKT